MDRPDQYCALYDAEPRFLQHQLDRLHEPRIDSHHLSYFHVVGVGRANALLLHRARQQLQHNVEGARVDN